MTIQRVKLLSVSLVLLSALLLLQPSAVLAQNTSPPPMASTSDEQLLKPQELDALVAPIALYPDPLLSLVLMASTYPLEVVQAERWLNGNKNLTGDQLRAAVEKQPWDDSIKSLVATPNVLEMMNAKLEWTQKLGDAVLAQQEDVMAAVQRLRLKAETNNKLKSTKEQKVTRREEGGREVVVIDPAEPDTIYVPYYDPAVVYGEWPYPDYPPYYFSEPAYIGTGIIATGIAFGAAYGLGRWASNRYYWGGGFNWNRNNININRPRNTNTIANNWQHRPEHRQGVKYNNPNVQQKFSGARGGGEPRTVGGGERAREAGGERGRSQGARPDGERTAGERATGERAKAQQKRTEQQRNSRTSQQQRGQQQRSSSAKRQNTSKQAGTKQRQPSGARSGHAASRQAPAQRRSAVGSPGGAGRAYGGGNAYRGGGGGGGGGGGAVRSRGGGGGGGGAHRGGGGRRSDIAVKHNIVLLGRLANGIGFYRFSYNGDDRTYVGVLAQEVQTIVPEATTRGADGYLHVFYDKLGLKLQTYDRWLASGAKIPRKIPRVGTNLH